MCTARPRTQHFGSPWQLPAVLGTRQHAPAAQVPPTGGAPQQNTPTLFPPYGCGLDGGQAWAASQSVVFHVQCPQGNGPGQVDLVLWLAHAAGGAGGSRQEAAPSQPPPSPPSPAVRQHPPVGHLLMALIPDGRIPMSTAQQNVATVALAGLVTVALASGPR